MRKILAFMLLAGAAAPALAAGDPGDRHGHWSRSDSSESQDSHQQSQPDQHERSSNSERPHFNVERAQPPVNVERSQERVHIDRNNGERLRMGQAENGSVQAEVQADQQRELRARERFRGPKIVTPDGSDGERLRQSNRQLPVRLTQALTVGTVRRHDLRTAEPFAGPQLTLLVCLDLRLDASILSLTHTEALTIVAINVHPLLRTLDVDRRLSSLDVEMRALRVARTLVLVGLRLLVRVLRFRAVGARPMAVTVSRIAGGKCRSSRPGKKHESQNLTHDS